MNNKELSEQLAKMHPMIMKAFHQIDMAGFKGFDLPVIQLKMLMVIAYKKTCHLNDLASFLHVTLSWASESVEQMVQKNLIQRDVSTVDRRKIDLSLAPQGEKFVKEFETWKKEYFLKLLQKIEDPGKINELMNAFKTFYDIALFMDQKDQKQ